jgi:putative DNA primase/helicase
LGGIASVAQYWEKNFQDFWSKQGFSWPQLADYLMSQCRERGIYDPSRIRGRGAWLEGDQPILHIGDALIVNGERHPLVYPGSRYLYEADATLVKDITKPLLTREANWLIKICRLLRWECPASGTLLAGWIAVAPICGALQWRPSIWVTGSSGSGKSWLMDNIVNTCLSEIGLYVAFNTTEPGIRRALHCDARPVIFDEAERDSASSALRMDDIFGYQRVASSENSVQILKGDQHGKFKAYKPRSVFLFQSINVGLTKGADESRISILGLRDKSIPGDIPFADLEAATAERITPEFASGLIARSVALIPVIRQNAKTFARAIAAHMHSQRLGDQLGTLLAGAYSLHSSGLISAEDAAAYVAKEEWQAQTPQEEEKDEYRLVRHIMASRVRVNNVEMPVSRLLEASQQFEAHEGMPAPDLAQRALSEAGIKPGYQENVPGVYFSTNHPRMREMLKGTQWDASWSRSLARLPDALSGSEVIQRFALGHRSRAVWVPWATIDPRD